MMNSEEKLIKEAINGESEAFGGLYDKYQAQIYRFVYLKVGIREEAEDLTHQVFLKSWENISEYTFQGFPFSSWLYRIARNQIIDYYRTKKSNLNLEDFNENPCLRTENPAPQKIDIDLDVERIKSALTRLSPEQQDVIILRFAEDFPLKETALIMDKSETAVKLLQHRAIKNLKKILGVSY